MRVISMDWRDVLVASWPVNPSVVNATLPDGLTAHERDGDAWLSAVPFVMGDVRPYRFPRFVGRTFGELNLRTYVRGPAGPGIYFYNLDAADRLGVELARRLFDLPYYRAVMQIDRQGDHIDFESHRSHPEAPECDFDATYRPNEEASIPPSDSLDNFLFERYRFYVESEDQFMRGEIQHEPWEVADADIELRENELFAANDFEHPSGEPHVAYSPGVEVTAEWIERA